MKRFISLLLVLVFIFSLSACSCNIDWSNFDLTKHNFGLTDEKSESVSDTDSSTPSVEENTDNVFSNEIINYIVPENNTIVYKQWNVAASDEFESMAREKLLEIAELSADLIEIKKGFSEYSTVTQIASDENFARILNNIRAWSFGAANYPTEGLSESEIEILNALVTIGIDTAEYGARLPALVITEDTENISAYENLIISQIVSLDASISHA